MDKSPDAFRTISEVADHLETPAHVLRFWESRFPQIRPVKRAGGRRYYRPSDVALLTGIKRLLHDEGLTIRGVQKILRDHGVRHVAGLSDDTVAMDEMLASPALGADLTAEDVKDLEDVDDLEDTRDHPAAPLDMAGEVPEAAFIAVEDDEPDPRPAPVQAVLPLFDTARSAPAPKPEVKRKPTSRDDATFASQIRALPPGRLAKTQPEIAALVRRLAALRAQMAERADGGTV
jgi:DNA-binding transcriptional MerR regulator